MGLRRQLLYWRRVVRYKLSNVSLAHAPDDYGFAPRILGSQLVLVATLLCGGYLIGRISVPNCAPVPDAGCAEAQAPMPVAAPEATPQAPPTLAPTLQTTTTLAPTPQATTTLAPTLQATTTLAPPPPVPPLPSPQGPSTAGARPLTSDEVREMQAWLKAFGFDPGPIDGYPGSRTKAAVKRYQAARQAEETGLPDRSLLRQVRKDAGQS